MNVVAIERLQEEVDEVYKDLEVVINYNKVY